MNTRQTCYEIGEEEARDAAEAREREREEREEQDAADEAAFDRAVSSECFWRPAPDETIAHIQAHTLRIRLARVEMLAEFGEKAAA